MVIGLPKIIFSKGFYQGYTLGKQPENKYERVSNERTFARLEFIHSNIYIPFNHIPMSECKYVLTFIDEFSRYCWLYFLKHKSEVLTLFKGFKAQVENQSGRNSKILRYDNDGVYFKHDVIQYCEDACIQMQHSIPYTRQQNGVAERNNRSLKEMATCMMESNTLPPNF